MWEIDGGVSRRYILRLPANYDNGHPYRLILSYHWATGSASQVFNCHTEGIDCLGLSPRALDLCRPGLDPGIRCRG